MKFVTIVHGISMLIAVALFAPPANMAVQAAGLRSQPTQAGALDRLAALTGMQNPEQRSNAEDAEREVADNCPPPDPGEGFCGVGDDGYCYYCTSDKPHWCPASKQCYAYSSDAQADCGSSWVVCGSPVN